MRVKAAADDEQYRLITECRTSGLTDYQWCLKHDIKLGTFYGWVNRLRKAGAYNIPNAAKFPKAFGQEIIRVEITHWFPKSRTRLPA